MITNQFLTTWSISNGLKTGYLIIVDDFIEKKCSCCDGYFPCDKEFWHADRGRLKSRCKPCWHDTRHHSQIPPTTIQGRPRKDKAA